MASPPPRIPLEAISINSVIYPPVPDTLANSKPGTTKKRKAPQEIPLNNAVQSKAEAKKTKKPKLDLKINTDFEGITLEGEDDCEVPVYDSCDETRRKINLFLSRTSMSKSQFTREISKSFGINVEKKVSPGSLTAFLAKSGPTAGNTSAVFYASYVFFEKMRIRDGEPKSEHREVMEEVWDGTDFNGPSHPGMDLKKLFERVQYIVPANAEVVIYQDEYGKVQMGW